MNIFNFKIITKIIFVIIFFSTSSAKPLDKFEKSESVSNYFSGILLLNDSQYGESFKYLKKLHGLERNHINYSVKYLYSLVNSGNIKEAFRYSKRLEKQKLNNFESDFISAVFYLKNSNKDLAKKYFLKAKNFNSGLVLNNYLTNSLYHWSNLSNINLNEASIELKKLDERFDNLKKIQNTFLNCFFSSPNTKSLFNQLISDKKTDFTRYYYFYASYLSSLGKIEEAKNLIRSGLEYSPRNLILNQYIIDLNKKQNLSAFNCKKEEHVAAEILYITANALASQSIYPLSNFYLNLAKYLNKDFISFDSLLAENFFMNNNFDRAKIIYNNLNKHGEAYQWFASKQLARILLKDESNDKTKALNLVSNAYEKLSQKNIYETFDYAEFLKNNEKFKDSIHYYSKILNNIEKDHPLYAEVTDSRGVAFEQIGEWKNAEKDLLASLKANPKQAYVINYLAYSWIEQGIKIEKSLSMLEKANKLKSNDPYITDSLGWALFKLERFKEAKEYLQLAVRLLPGDPIVNDHFGDVLWKNGNEIQARYYWKNVLKLEKTEDKLKKTIYKKIIRGL
tara:strand:+ start:10454 stop:12148 length:1695 start_codon:yes stop_codon:yes gene_type:complete